LNGLESIPASIVASSALSGLDRENSNEQDNANIAARDERKVNTC